MAKVNGKRLGIGVVMGVTFVLIAGGLFGLVNSAVSQTSVQANSPIGGTTIEGNAATGVAVGTAAPAAGDEVAVCEFNDWVGKTGTEAEAAAKATGRPYRILPPGSAMTMDFRADRINVELDSKDVVTKVTCG